MSKLYVGHEPDTDVSYLLVVHPDGTHELATRPGFRSTDVAWGRPVVLVPQSSEVTQ